jgi:hypothetical protein
MFGNSFVPRRRRCPSAVWWKVGLRERGVRDSILNLIFPQVFDRHIVLWNFFRVNSGRVRVGCIFHAADRFGFEGLSLLDQFFDAL